MIIAYLNNITNNNHTYETHELILTRLSFQVVGMLIMKMKPNK